MAGRWNTVDLRRQDSVSSAVLPTISRQADSEARTIADATPKVKALLNYMVGHLGTTPKATAFSTDLHLLKLHACHALHVCSA